MASLLTGPSPALLGLPHALHRVSLRPGHAQPPPYSLETLLSQPCCQTLQEKGENKNTSLAEFRFGDVGFMTSVLFCFDD